MPRSLRILPLLLALACGKVSGHADAGGTDHRDDSGSGVVADAAPFDATPVACDGPEDCANPDDPCLQPGTCGDDGVCHFEAMDCSDLDDECRKGFCQDGACRRKSVREGEACGAGIMDCGAFADCGAFDGICDESGTHTRSCADSTCQAGTCVTGAAYSDTQACLIDTDGVQCGDPVTSCTETCNYSSSCDRDAPARQCVTTEYSCAGGACGDSQTSAGSIDDCHRDTECQACTRTDGSVGNCTAAGGCGPPFCQ
jgi:hypothetical protein